MTKEMTHREFDAVHSDFKLTAAESASGVPMVMTHDPKYGTCLIPVTLTKP